MFVPRFVQLFRILVALLDVYRTSFGLIIYIKQWVKFISGSTICHLPIRLSNW